MRPIWKALAKNQLDDNMYNCNHMLPWPGYIENAQFPFGYNNVFVFDSKDPKNLNQWCSTDSEADFDKNKLSMPPTWRYHTKVVRYTCNTSGFRTYEWDNINWSEAIVIFGDSCTFGVGLDDDETISYALQQLTGRQVINLGVPGGSNSLMVNLSADLKEKFGNPYAVIMNWSTSDRFRFYHEAGYHEAGPWDSSTATRIDGLNVSSLWKFTYANPYHEMCINYYTGKVSSSMWKDSTKYISVSYFPDSANYIRAERQFKIDNGARDRIHPGPDNSAEVANYIFNRLKEL